jgi:phosphatidylglycerol:prolipoprotein diacylglycerol transferase
MRPILLQLGSIAVRAYGTMLVIAFLAAIAWAVREARLRRTPPERVYDLAFWILVSGVFFARLIFVLLDLPYYTAHPADLIPSWRTGVGGLSFHGGFLGAILAAALYARKARLSFWTLADVCAPAAALGYAIARVGCFLNGCCYGRPTDLPWGLRFPLEGGLPGQLTPPSHPTQIYSVIGGLVIFLVLIRLRNRLPHPGQLFIAFVGLYGVERFVVEIWRSGATSAPLWGPITLAQVVSLVAIAATPFFLRWRAARDHGAGHA